MAETWPPTIQKYLNRSGFSRIDQDATIRTTVDTGPVKQRRRFSSPQIRMRSTIWANTVDFNTFKNFYDVTLQNGSLTFNFEDPQTGQMEEWRFVEPYSTSPLGGDYYVISMNWESVP